LLFSMLSHSPTIAVLSSGFLLGKTVLNILAPEGNTVYRRSLIGYGLGAVYVLIGIVSIHFMS
jgi:hypothetical protein